MSKNNDSTDFSHRKTPRSCATCFWFVLFGYSQCGKQYGWCEARREYRYTTQKCKRYKKYDQSTKS